MFLGLAIIFHLNVSFYDSLCAVPELQSDEANIKPSAYVYACAPVTLQVSVEDTCSKVDHGEDPRKIQIFLQIIQIDSSIILPTKSFTSKQLLIFHINQRHLGKNLAGVDRVPNMGHSVSMTPLALNTLFSLFLSLSLRLLCVHILFSSHH